MTNRLIQPAQFNRIMAAKLNRALEAAKAGVVPTFLEFYMRPQRKIRANRRNGRRTR